MGLTLSLFLPQKFMNYLIIVWARAIFIFMGTPLKVMGKENIDRQQNYILLTNHASLYDIPAVAAVFPWASWIGREYLTKIPLFNCVLKKMNYISVGKNPALQVRQILSQSIDNSKSLTIVIFPEGTRTRDGHFQEFKRGFIHIFKNSELNILPITLNGMFRLKPKNRFFIKPFVRLELVVNKPMNKGELENFSPQEIIERVKTIMLSNYRI